MLGMNDTKEYAWDDFISENNGTKNEGIVRLQGFVNLADTKEEDGGFRVVPGFQKHLKEWSELTKELSYAKTENNDFIYVPPGDSLHSDEYLQKVTARAGSLVIWRSELPHCNYSNSSKKFRMVTYLKMVPARWNAPGTRIRKMEIAKRIPKDFELTELGKKLLGFEEWEKKV